MPQDFQYRTFINQVKQYLIDTDNEDLSPHKAFKLFEAGCRQFSVNDYEVFAKEVYKIATKEINWNYERSKKHEASQKKREEIKSEFIKVENTIEPKEKEKRIEVMLNRIFQYPRINSESIIEALNNLTQTTEQREQLSKKIHADYILSLNLIPVGKVDASGSIATEITSTDWFKPPALSSSSKQNIISNYFISIYQKIKENVLLSVVIGILLLFIITVLIFQNRTDCVSCKPPEFTIQYLFTTFILALLALFAVHHTLLNHHSRRWQKPPAFLSFPLVGIASSITLISIFFGLHTDILNEYDTNTSSSPWYWFCPSNVLKFPAEQIEYNGLDNNLTKKLAPLSTVYIKSDDHEGQKYLYLTIVDRTTSSKENDMIKRMSNNQKVEFCKYIGIDSSLKDSITLKDYIAGSTNVIINKTANADNSSSHIVCFTGVNSYDSAVSVNFGSMLGDKPNKEWEKYYGMCRTLDAYTKGKEKLIKSNFAYFFGKSDTSLFDRLRDTTQVGSKKLILTLISDLHHDDTTCDLLWVENEFCKLIHNKKKYWSIDQVNVYVLPLYREEANKGIQIASLPKMFKKNCEMTYLHNLSVMHDLANEHSLIKPQLFSSLIGDNSKSGVIRFLYSSKRRNAKSVFKICLPEEYQDDTLICSLIDNRHLIKNDFDDYRFQLIHEKKSCAIDEFNEVPYGYFGLIDVNSDDVVRIEIEKSHIPKAEEEIQLEIFSSKLKSKVRIPIEFCEVMPNTTNIWLLILYALLYFSFILYTILPLHHYLLYKLVFKVVGKNETPIVLSSLALMLSIVLAVILFEANLSIYELPNKFWLVLIIVIGFLIAVTFIKYRYYVSKHLYFFSNGQSNSKSISNRFGFLFIRDNKLKESQNNEQVNNIKPYN